MKSEYLKYIDMPFDQEGCRYKVNSDTVALGMFLDPMKNKSVLDIGCNSGALLLYALHQGATELSGVDIHEDALICAERNLHKYCRCYRLFHSRVQDLKLEKQDVVICNPPFFEMNNVTDDAYLKQAMFEQVLPLDELFEALRRLMKANGEAYIIYQADRFPELYDMCRKFKFKIMKMRFVHDIRSRHALRVLMKLKIGPMSKLKVLQPLMIDRGNFVEGFQKRNF